MTNRAFCRGLLVALVVCLALGAWPARAGERVAVKLRPGVSTEVLAARGLTAIRQVAYAPNTYICTAPDKRSAEAEADRLATAGLVDFAAPLPARMTYERLIPNDLLFPSQWTLRNTGQTPLGFSGNDADIVAVWDAYQGAGINIAIVDTGIEESHEDLFERIRADLSFDYLHGDADASPPPGVGHGTSCAGVAAATGNNAKGIAGAAFSASLVNVLLVGGPSTDEQKADALTHQLAAEVAGDLVHIYACPWGPSDDGLTIEAPGPLLDAALAAGVRNGRGGLGAIYVWAGGNGAATGDDMNFDGYASSPYVLAVGATGSDGSPSPIGEPGASMLINAPSSDSASGTVTCTVNNTYTLTFGGTSAASSLVAGAVALLLEANPALGWRDVQDILVRTADKNDPAHPDWFDNAAGLHFNRHFGFGRINTTNAALAALAWEALPPAAPPLAGHEAVGLPIPDNSGAVARSLEVRAPAHFQIERALVTVNIAHPNRGQLRFWLTSPSGTEVLLADSRPDTGADLEGWTFSSTATWGEDPTGPWTLRLEDTATGDTGTWAGWGLAIRGHVAEGPGGHLADQDSNGRLNLSELLRIIQFYNAGSYRCGVDTEDGYAPGPGVTPCTAHSCDYAPRDGVVSLNELLRVIQLYNAGGYAVCLDGEDGFCPLE